MTAAQSPLDASVPGAEVPAVSIPSDGRDTCARCGEHLCEHHYGLWSNPASDGGEAMDDAAGWLVWRGQQHQRDASETGPAA